MMMMINGLALVLAQVIWVILTRNQSISFVVDLTTPFKTLALQYSSEE
jgi:hypothetical protein